MGQRIRLVPMQPEEIAVFLADPYKNAFKPIDLVRQEITTPKPPRTLDAARLNVMGKEEKPNA